MDIVTVFLFIAMGATALVLIAGVTLMAVGGPMNARFSNKLMTARVLLQGAALVFFALLLTLGGKG